MALSPTNRVLYAHLVAKASPLSCQAKFARWELCRVDGLASATIRPGNVIFQRAFARSAVPLQKSPGRKSLSDASNPSKKSRKPAWERRVDHVLERRWSQKEQSTEDNMRRLMEEASPSPEEDARSEYRRERRAERLASDLEIVGSRREMLAAMNASMMLERNSDGIPPALAMVAVKTRLCNVMDDLWFAEVRAWRLYTFAPLTDVAILSRFWKSFCIVPKTLLYALMRLSEALLIALSNRESVKDSLKKEEEAMRAEKRARKQ